ncbi:unnamed protein product [Rhizophagus irregularis]|nr:unnamed protein product [Rhizophagus irregularis]
MSRKLVTRAFSKFKTKEPKEVKDNDVIIYVGKEPDFKEFQSNSKIMRSKSDYFKKILSDKNIEKKDEKYVIKIPDVTPQVFDVIIKYLSTGKINVKNKTGIEILNVMITSDELKLNQLIRHIEDSLIENQNFLQDDPVEVLQMVYYNKSLGNNIQEFCLKSICFEPKNFFNSAKASRDGNTAEEFHTRCDNKGATIVVVKIENSEQIVGGYNSLLWNSSGENMSTKDNFIFSFTDKTNLQSAQVVYSNGDQYSVRYLPNYGPAFGNSDLYVDYNIATNIWYSHVSSYPTLNLPITMKVVDYEVFRVIKN